MKPKTESRDGTLRRDPDDLPRVAIAEDGRIAYASGMFCALFGITDEQEARGRLASSVLTFADPEEAFSAAGMFRRESADASREAGGTDWAMALRPGTHGLIPPGKSRKARPFRFEWISAPDGRRFLVAAPPEETPSRGRSRDKAAEQVFLRLIAREEPAAEAAPPAEKIDAGSTNGELRHFLNISHDLLAVSTADGRFVRVNPSFNDVLGYSDEELRKTHFLDLVHADDRHEARSSLRALSLQDESVADTIIDFESRMLTRDGSMRWMEWRLKRAGGHIYCVGRDVTGIKEQEDALRKRQQQLSEAEAIGHMGHWHWTVGEETIEWSDEIYRIFGVERGSFIPTLDSLNGMVHRRDVGRLLQAFQRAIIEHNDYDLEFRAVRPDGETRHVRCQGRCERDADGDVVALYGIMQDFTERTLYEKQLREAKDGAERAYAAKSQFLANMSHELRTPLNAIIGFSEMMQRQLLGPIGTEKYLDYITGIRESGEHLLDLISDILDMSKIEAGKYELDLEEINIVKVIRLAVHMMGGRAHDAGIDLKIEVSNEDRMIVADRRAVMQILLNLLSNSVKFTRSGGWVRVECVEREDYLSIKVHDNGCGIPASQLQNITRPFEQAASHYTRDHQGSGLGLAITKELIEMHGGTLHIESTLGVGTTVTVRLPYDAYTKIRKRKAAAGKSRN